MVQRSLRTRIRTERRRRREHKEQTHKSHDERPDIDAEYVSPFTPNLPVQGNRRKKKLDWSADCRNSTTDNNQHVYHRLRACAGMRMEVAVYIHSGRKCRDWAGREAMYNMI